MFVAAAVEGPTDQAAVEKILASRSLSLDFKRVYQTGGKAKLDQKIASYNAAAQRSPWFVLRDSDRDGQDCPARARAKILPLERQSSALCFRLAVRALEAWLLADKEAFAREFAVSPAAVPPAPESLLDPKLALIEVCRKSRKADVRRAMVPPASSGRKVGPEYTTFVSEYCRNAWRPDTAAMNAPSLSRALEELDKLVQLGAWY